MQLLLSHEVQFPGARCLSAGELRRHREERFASAVSRGQTVCALACELIGLERSEHQDRRLTPRALGTLLLGLEPPFRAAEAVVLLEEGCLDVLLVGADPQRMEAACREWAGGAKELELDGLAGPARSSLRMGYAVTQPGKRLYLDTLLLVARAGLAVARCRGPGACVHTMLYDFVQERLERERGTVGIAVAASAPPQNGHGGEARDPVVAPAPGLAIRASATTDTERKAPSAPTDTERKAPSAPTDTERKAPSAPTDTERKAPSAPTDTERKAPSAPTDTERKAPSAPTDTERKAPSAPADTERRELELAEALDAQRRENDALRARLRALETRPEPASRWTPETLAADSASGEDMLRIDLLERRLAKVTRSLEEAEQCLAGVSQAEAVDSGIASRYRTVQGLEAGAADRVLKAVLLEEIFEANLELRERLRIQRRESP